MTTSQRKPRVLPSSKPKKLLVANSSEIAIRVMRAATELGLKTAAICAKEDRFSMHRFKADEACRVGDGKGPVGAYLDIEGIMAAACAEAGILFVGPRPELLGLTGDKVAARALTQKLQAPTVAEVNVMIGDSLDAGDLLVGLRA